MQGEFPIERIEAMTLKERNELIEAIKTESPLLLAEVLHNPLYPLSDDSRARLFEEFVVPNKNPANTWNPYRIHHNVVFRTGTKSVSVAISILQSILACPNIRIMIVSGTLPLAQDIFDMVGQFARHPAILYLFPKMRDAKFFSDYTFVSPLRTNLTLKEPTLRIASVGSDFTGWHGDLIFADDLMTNKNTITDAGIAKTKEMFAALLPLVEGEGGHIIHTCTRYATDDLIASEMQQYEEHPESKRHFYIQPIMRIRTDGAPLEITQRQARLRKGYSHLLDSDIIPTCPERFPLAKIRELITENPNNFATQYMLLTDVVTARIKISDEELDDIFARPSNWYDRNHVQVINWDMAGLSNPTEAHDRHDEHAGIRVSWDAENRTMIVQDIVCEKFFDGTERVDTTEAVWLFARARSTHEVFVRVENASSLKDMLAPLLAERGMVDSGVAPNTFWRIPTDSKESRIQRALRAMREGHICFAPGCRSLDELRRQVVYNNPDSTSALDDILDSLSQAYAFCVDSQPVARPQSETPSQRQAREFEEQEARQRQEAEEQAKIQRDKQARIAKHRAEREWEENLPDKWEMPFNIYDLKRAGIDIHPSGEGLGGKGWMLFQCRPRTNPAHKAWCRRVQDAINAGLLQPRRG